MLCRYALDLVDIHYYCSVFFMLYSHLKRMKYFLIPVSVSIADYRENVEIIVIFKKLPNPDSTTWHNL